ncbi:hypothetical protein PRIPAC_82220, partial [Pristionchus pacificus]|uniref:Uncharacterized protein n=1 Tax=Pristionchus pacificus TaxID=54126 RepID=A0A2A6CN13_PRIPA
MQPVQTASSTAPGPDLDPDDVLLDKDDDNDDRRDIYVTVELPGDERPLIEKIHRLLFTQCNDLRRTANGRYLMKKRRLNSVPDSLVTATNRNLQPVDLPAPATVSVPGPSASTTSGLRSKLNSAIKVVQNAVQSGNRFRRLVDVESTTSAIS